MAASMGWAAQFGAGAANPVTSQFEFISCGIGKRGALVESPGCRGTRSHIHESVNEGPYTVGGAVVMEPRPDELDFWLPYILGGAESTDVFPLAETLPVAFVTIDKIAKVYTYDGMKVARAVFASSPAQNLRLTMDLEGKTETPGNAGTFPAISSTLSVLQPYIHQQAVLTLVSTPYVLANVEVTINNSLILDRLLNSVTRTELPEADRIITVSCDNPFTATEAGLYDMALAGVAGTLKYTNGARSLLFTFANLKVPSRGPEIAGRNREIPLRLELQAFRSGVTDAPKELVVTNDNTV